MARCVALLARQRLEEPFEVVVGVDGPAAGLAERLRRLWPAGGDSRLRVLELPRMGYIAVRRRLLLEAQGELVLSLNDDVEPEPGLLAAHIDRHRQAKRERGALTVVVSGRSPFVRFRDETLLERLVRETNMVFFQRTASDDPWRDLGYRQAFGLNVSFPRAAALEAGGFPELRRAYGYDDIELAWRLSRRFGAPVLDEPRARAPHRHRMGAEDLLRRERLLGRCAWLYAQVNPAFAIELFGQDLRDERTRSKGRMFVELTARDAARQEATLRALERLPAEAVATAPEAAGALLEALSQQWTTLKRRLWWEGVLEAAAAGTGLEEGADGESARKAPLLQAGCA